MTAVVGLDLSLSSTGIAWTSDTADPPWYVLHWNPGRLRGVDRLLDIRAGILRTLQTGPDIIVIEDLPHGLRNSAAGPLGELHGVVKVALADGGYPTPTLIPPATLKLWSCGKGNADKTAMVVAARDRLGYTGTQTDEADALLLLALGCELAGRPLCVMPKTHMRDTTMNGRLFDVPELETETRVTLSATQRLTARRRDLLAAGKHPATGLRVIANGHTCGDCGHHEVVTHYSARQKYWHKCDMHRLGQSHSEASDIRVSWPACELWRPEGDDAA